MLSEEIKKEFERFNDRLMAVEHSKQSMIQWMIEKTSLENDITFLKDEKKNIMDLKEKLDKQVAEIREERQLLKRERNAVAKKSTKTKKQVQSKLLRSKVR